MDREKQRNHAYLYWLHRVPKLGDKEAMWLLENYGSAEEIYGLSEENLRGELRACGCTPYGVTVKTEAFLAFRQEWNVMEQYIQMQEKGIKMVPVFDAEYPRKLLSIPYPPMILYYKGELPKEGKCSIAMIGARECSEYGKRLARAFGEQMGKCGINVISGMARGIDGISQEAAIAGGGKTYAVLGCGVDICYPASAGKLYDSILTNGGILSPFPPGTEPRKQNFPYRNSIVAGLADAVLVLEARQKSGTALTVDMALEQGKDVYAVPGRLTDRLSDGCNMLIRQGAGIALSPEDMVTELVLLKNREAEEEIQKKKNRRAFTQAEKLSESQSTTQGTTGRMVQVPEQESERAEKCSTRQRQQSLSVPVTTPSVVTLDTLDTSETRTKKKDPLLSLLDLYPRSAEDIYQSAIQRGMKLTYQELLSKLIGLCMDGMAKQVSGNWFVLG